jgi:hypothetical protein
MRTTGKCALQFSGSLVDASGRPTITDGTHADRGRDPVGDFPFIVATGVR